MYTIQDHYLAYNFIELSPFSFNLIFNLGCFGYILFRWSNNQKDSFKRFIEEQKQCGKISNKENTNIDSPKQEINEAESLEEESENQEDCIQIYLRGTHNLIHRKIKQEDNIAEKILPEYKDPVQTFRQFKMFGMPVRALNVKYYTLDGTIKTSYLLLSGFWGIARHLNYTGDILLSSTWCLMCGFGNILPYFYIIYIFLLLLTRTFRDETKCSGKYGNGWKEYCKRVPYRFIPNIF
jgi:hypothetical protein